ncbi:unnamed protein product [Soboliphyme baturini]|uniref:DNA-binding protein n=1 Tax=Soboliphyme baturini TaxID=241478 RepID=A0A183IKA1_9BILA|nr:unnamed protein product [Soboliphyme baturini]
MLEVQELFKSANKLSRSEKALILGFLAGNKENPFPHMGNRISIRLSENEESYTCPDGQVRQVIVETLLQMDYETGLCKKLKKVKSQEPEKTPITT